MLDHSEAAPGLSRDISAGLLRRVRLLPAKADGIPLPGDLIIGTDFLSVYAAADLAMAGDPGAAYADAPHLSRMREMAGSTDAPDRWR